MVENTLAYIRTPEFIDGAKNDPGVLYHAKRPYWEVDPDVPEMPSEITPEIEKEFGFTPDFEKSKYYLEANDGAGNTFKATAKPVLIGTAVVGATTMIFSLILVIHNKNGYS